MNTGHLPADAPQLMDLPQGVTVELGRSALLACRAAGRPPPMVAWRRADGQPLEPGRGSRTRQPDSGVLFFESKRTGEQGWAGSGDRMASDTLRPQPGWPGRTLSPSADRWATQGHVQPGDSGQAVSLL